MQIENSLDDAPQFIEWPEKDLPKIVVSEEVARRQLQAAMIASISAALGVVGNLMFYGTLPGLNILLFALLLSAAAVGLLIYFRQPISTKNMIFLLPGLIFAAMLAIYSAPELVMFNLLMLLGTIFIALRYANVPRLLGGGLLQVLFDAAAIAIIGWLEAPVSIVKGAVAWFKRQEVSETQGKNLISIVRGVMLTIPVLLVFGLLLSSADMVFGDLMSDVAGFLLPDNSGILVTQGFITVIFAWLSVIVLWAVPLETRHFPAKSEEKSKPAFQLSMIESSMVLTSANVMFLIFVLIQARYLFGGDANITAQGYTYSQYAVRGFYELVAVSVMTVGLILTLDIFTHRKRDREYTFRSLALVMVGLTLLLLVAAFRRLILYEDAYGFTRLRVQTQVLMLWLGILFLFLARDIVWREKRFFWIGILVTAIGFVLTLNLINLDRFIASHNIERYEETGKLDVPYLLTLSDDAIPVIAPLLDDNLNNTQREILLNGLGERLYVLDQDKEDRSWLGFHFGKDRARDALEPYRSMLQPYYENPYRYKF